MIDIKDISGNIRLSTSINGGSKRKFTLMKEDYITLKFNVDSPLYFKLGDGIDNSEIGLFELIDLYKPTRNDSTGGYDYELRLDAYYWKWKNKKFFYTPDTGGSEASWNLTATLAVHLNVFLKNLSTLGYTYKGIAFEFSIDSTVENSAKLVSYDNTNLIDALTNLADTWDCEWWITDNIIHFGRCEYGDPVDFEYGVNVSSMTRSDSQSSYATRIYAFGSTRNLPTNYRPIDESLVVNGVVQKRLMLPSGTPYIDAYENMSTEEAVEDIVVFEDIYPKRVGTISEVSQTSGNYLDQDNNPTGETYPIYTIKDLSLINFKKEYLLSGVELRFVFQSGALFGLDFALTLKSSDDTGTVFEIVRNEDYGRYLPDEVLKPQIGDTYVLYGFDTSLVSDTMIPAAEQELKEKALAYVEKAKTDPSTYDCKVSFKYMYNDDDPRLFAVGDKVNLINPAYFEAGRKSRIIGFEYNLDYPYDNPTYTVGETASYSRLSEIEQKVDAVTYKGQTYTGSGGSGVYVIGQNDNTSLSDRNVFSSFRALAEIASRALSRLKDDIAEGVITFSKGLISKADSIFEKSVTVNEDLLVDKDLTVGETLTAGEIKNATHIPGQFGSGYRIKVNPKTGDSEAEVDRLLVRKEAIFNKLSIAEIKSVGGAMLLSCASMTCQKVEESEDVYRCFFDTDEGTITNPFAVDDQAICRRWNGQGMKYYWRLVTAVGTDYIDLSKTDVDGLGVPTAQDEMIQLGNRTDTSRQSALYKTAYGINAPAEYQYDGIDSYDLSGKEAVIVSPSGNKFTGEFHVKTGNTSVRVPADKGEWVAGAYSYYDRVSHNGSLWLAQVNTSEEPGDSSADWLKQVSEGGTGYRIEKLATPGYEFYRENQIYNHTLSVRVYFNEEDITGTLNMQRFKWTRVSENTDGDPTWNELHANSGHTIDITGSDLAGDTFFILQFYDVTNNRILTTKF